MKVPGNLSTDLSASKTPATNTPKTQPEPVQTALAAAPSAGVEVVLTSGARALGKDTANAPAEVDAKKVASMKAAIADGSFTINPEAIADKLLSNAEDMLNAQRR